MLERYVFFSEQKVAKEVPAVSEVTRFDTFLSQKRSTVPPVIIGPGR